VKNWLEHYVPPAHVEEPSMKLSRRTILKAGAGTALAMAGARLVAAATRARARC
jgi:hypothetical protein